jgi:16S rRNA (uracil1498-N3)-methyltransferase
MNRELPAKVTLCQSILNYSLMDETVRTSTEMGFTDVVPVRAARTIGKFTSEDEQKLFERWSNRVKDLRYNSRREFVPTVHPPIDLSEAIEMVKDYDVAILAYENETDPTCTKKALEACKAAKNIIIFIGPERGFEPEEVAMAEAAGVKIVTLGKRIIRAVNAGAVLMSMLIYAIELDG